MTLRATLALAFLAAPVPLMAQGTRTDPTTALVLRLEEAAAAGDTSVILSLGTPEAPGLRRFASLASPTPTRFVIKERDRGGKADIERLLLEVFAQHGNESVITTWRMDVGSKGEPPSRRIVGMEQLTVVSGLYNLALNPVKQFQVRNLRVQGTDLTLELPAGAAFVAETPEGPTAVVLLGRGRMRFAPSDPAERTQVRIFSGDDALSTDFDAAFVRVRPAEFASTFDASSLTLVPVAHNQFRRAADVFDDYVGQTLHIDLTDLSRERWSLVPNPGDLVAEVRTRRLGSLTYARSSKDPEDISLFERKRHRNIAVYASRQKLASRGPFYSEDELAEYDVLRHDVDVAITPDRLWVEGHARATIRIRSAALTALTLRLAEPLVVRSVVSDEHGRLLHLRVVGQNSVIINFPTSVLRDEQLSLTIVYGGRLEPQRIDVESVGVQQSIQEEIYIPIEPQYIYSNRSYWYPQATVSDYAAVHLRVSVPTEYDVVATGTAAGPPTLLPAAPGEPARKLFIYDSERPVRYLALLISRFVEVSSRVLPVHTEPAPAATGSAGPQGTADGSVDDDPSQIDRVRSYGVTLAVHANPRQASRARSLADRAASIFQYYAELVGEAPYPSFTLAVTEHQLPGGHSPAYFAMLNQQPPLSPLVWRHDPVAFENYPPFFLAHEIAHQWWGQAVGWKNYHEQWLSEGFAQYFAVLYAEHDRGGGVSTGMVRQMRRWAVEQSPQGPVYLGYRLGHIRGDGRVFRAVVYNKGAMVLHMLRRMLGDDAFFGGIRRFYATWRFKKAGTDDLRAAMERAAGRDLRSFFDAWIYGSSIPALKFTSVVEGGAARVRLEHLREVVPVPVTVTILYTDGREEEQIVPVTERVVERTLVLNGIARSIEVNRDHAALAEITR